MDISALNLSKHAAARRYDFPEKGGGDSDLLRLHFTKGQNIYIQLAPLGLNSPYEHCHYCI